MRARPILRYYGGKFKLAKWIMSHFPQHKIYCEPFSGAASILLSKERSYAEIYNDLDREIVNLFKVVRDNGPELKSKIENTPFAREELTAAYLPTEDNIEAARRTIIKSLMGFGSNAIYKHSGFRGCATRSYTIPAHDWRTYPEAALSKIIERLRGVIIESSPAEYVLTKYDSSDTLFYVDPPYLPETRVPGKKYRHEMSISEHKSLLTVLKGLKGKVILSGYASSLYDDSLCDWKRVSCDTFADGALPRTEILWINSAAQRN